MRPEAQALIETLARRCRVLTIHQAAAAFYGGRRRPVESAYSAVQTLQKHGLVSTLRGSLGVVDPVAPLLRWGLTDGKPNLATIAWANERRWRDAKPRPTLCVFATDKGRLAFGGACRPSRDHEREHDLAVAAVYLQLLGSVGVAAWRHEDAFPPRAGERPDATYERDGETVTVEVLGRGYTRQKIEAVWRAYRDGPLELW
ncbi:hypothetical protein [Botrimarina mediterranea]|nr:hypothetical protein [Botrimarina mediterranea]